MSKFNSEKSIDEAILLLEEKQAIEGQLLKEEFYSITESLKPINLLKSTFQDAKESPELKANVLNSTLDLVRNYLSGMLHKNSENSTTKKIIGSALIHAVFNIYLKNPKTYQLLEALIQKKHTDGTENSINKADYVTTD